MRVDLGPLAHIIEYLNEKIAIGLLREANLINTTDTDSRKRVYHFELVGASLKIWEQVLKVGLAQFGKVSRSEVYPAKCRGLVIRVEAKL